VRTQDTEGTIQAGECWRRTQGSAGFSNPDDKGGLDRLRRDFLPRGGGGDLDDTKKASFVRLAPAALQGAQNRKVEILSRKLDPGACPAETKLRSPSRRSPIMTARAFMLQKSRKIGSALDEGSKVASR